MNATGPIDRRRFLQVSAAMSSLALTGSALSVAAEDKKDRFAGFKVGVQSYTFRNFDLEPALQRTKDLGLHYVEFYQKHAPIQSTPEQITALLKLCKDYEIK